MIKPRFFCRCATWAMFGEFSEMVWLGVGPGVSIPTPTFTSQSEAQTSPLFVAGVLLGEYSWHLERSVCIWWIREPVHLAWGTLVQREWEQTFWEMPEGGERKARLIWSLFQMRSLSSASKPHLIWRWQPPDPEGYFHHGPEGSILVPRSQRETHREWASEDHPHTLHGAQKSHVRMTENEA